MKLKNKIIAISIKGSLRMLTTLLLVFLWIQGNYAQQKPWLDTSLDMDTRISALVDAMTLEEKISQTIHNSASIDRLGVDEYNWWSEALHGVARSGRATVFPQSIGLAATFDPALLEKIGDAVSDEARAINNHLLDNGYTQRLYQGLIFWSPNVNIFRDPRWGRGQETYGEDPYLSGTLGAAFIRGMQGDHPKYMKETPLYPFGFGLGYAEIEWEKPSVGNSTIKKDQNLEISLNIRNNSSMDAEDVVQVYLSIENEKENMPISSLIDFKRIAVNKEEHGRVTFSVPYEKFSYYNSEGEKVQHQGKATVTVGNASPGKRSEQLGAKGFKIDVMVN